MRAKKSATAYRAKVEAERARDEAQLFSSYSVEDDQERVNEEYRQIVRAWGRMGGRAVLAKYGPEHFRELAKKRWRKA